MNSFSDHFRIADGCFELNSQGESSVEAGISGSGLHPSWFARRVSSRVAEDPGGVLFDAMPGTKIETGLCSLPFNLTATVENLRRERYIAATPVHNFSRSAHAVLRGAYYLVRPALPVSIRRHLQRASLGSWKRKRFPSWPVDRTVDSLFEEVLKVAIESRRREAIPFIWFWPDGKSSCAVMTHDVETRSGLEFCSDLMDLDASYGIKSSFQLIPGGRYSINEKHIGEIRARGFEVNVHDWNHDGRLFSARKRFEKRAAKINAFASRYSIDGFRSGALYRNTDWYDSFALAFDMSVPNCGHLDPQPGGCCTLMPYFVGKLLEIPVTTVQDYSLFHILGDYSTRLWRRQLHEIVSHNGLASFIVHPDYIIEKRARSVYMELLGILAKLSAESDVWLAKPGEVNRWWRERSRMRLENHEGEWRIVGAGSERARIAYAELHDHGLHYRLSGAPGSHVIGVPALHRATKTDESHETSLSHSK